MVEVNEWWQMLAIFFFAANPGVAAAGMAHAQGAMEVERYRWQIAAAGFATSALLVVIAVAIADPLVQLLNVHQGTFRIAAGSVMLVVAGQTIVRGHPGLREPGASWKAGIYPLGLPLIGGPAMLAAALNWSAEPDVSPWLTLAMALPALVLATLAGAFAPGGYGGQLAAIARLIAVLLAVGAVAIIVSGVQAV